MKKPNDQPLPRMIFTRRPSLLERIVNLHPAVPACLILLVLFGAIGIGELLLTLSGYGAR